MNSDDASPEDAPICLKMLRVATPLPESFCEPALSQTVGTILSHDPGFPDGESCEVKD